MAKSEKIDDQLNDMILRLFAVAEILAKVDIQNSPLNVRNEGTFHNTDDKNADKNYSTQLSRYDTEKRDD